MQNNAPQPSTSSSEAYAQTVQDAGGRLDFVFPDQRPFAQCHASTLAQTPDGAILCAWFGGTREKASDVAVWLARFEDGAWAPCERVAKIAEVAHWNPVLFTAPDGEVLLFFKVGTTVPRWRTFLSRSADGGRTWSEARELVPGDTGGRGPVRSKPIVLSDGAWLAPASTEQGDDNPGAWRAFVDRSTDRGQSWERSADFPVDERVVPGAGVIQPTLWESEPGRVHALLRSTGGVVARADSDDGGRHWSAVYDTGLPNNNSGIDALRLADGRVLLVYNPVAENWGPRSPLTLAVSADNGIGWRAIAHLEDDGQAFRGYDKLIAGAPAHAEGARSEYSYPAVIATRTGIAVSYTWRRERIRCWQIPTAALG